MEEKPTAFLENLDWQGLSMSSGSMKRVIKAKIKANKELTEEEQLREKMKYEIAEELGLADKVKREGWGGLSSGETGKIGGIMARRKKGK